MDGKIDKVREALIGSRFIIEKFTMGTHPALKKIDEAIVALSAVDPEAIRRVALQAVRKEIEKWRDDITCWDYDEGYLDGTDNALKIIDASILSAEPAQGDGKPEEEREETIQETIDRMDGYGIDNECGAR